MEIKKLNFNAINLIGKKFGKLTVINVSDKRGNRGQLKWVCKCDCGKEHIVSGEGLRSGHTKSCGCSRSGKNKNPDRENTVWRYLYLSTIVKRNKFKGFEKTDISLDDFITLSKQNCFYCNQEPTNIAKDRDHTKKGKTISDTVLLFNGIDRIDSSRGYFKDNVVPCCKKCNTAKNTMSQKDFKDWIEKVYKFYCVVKRTR